MLNIDRSVYTGNAADKSRLGAMCCGRENGGSRDSSCSALAHDNAPLDFSPYGSTPVLAPLPAVCGDLYQTTRDVDLLCWCEPACFASCLAWTCLMVSCDHIMMSDLVPSFSL